MFLDLKRQFSPYYDCIYIYIVSLVNTNFFYNFLIYYLNSIVETDKLYGIKNCKL